jgi:uncharacterized membrane protein (UPF0127 family)
MACSALAFGQGARFGAPMPRSHLKREAAVLWHADGSVTSLHEPGARDVTVPCANVRDMETTLRLEVERLPVQARDCSAEELLELCKARSGETVRFRDTVVAFRPMLGGGRDVLKLPGGVEAGVDLAFMTDAGFLCLVPTGNPATVELCGGSGTGMTWSLTGRPLLFDDGVPGLMVTDATYPGSEAEDEPPWRVRLVWQDAPAAETTVPGRYPVVLPCPFRPGSRERATVLLREYQEAALEVGGHPVRAELAATPSARSWGLQGRDSLDDDEGMLFYFPEPFRATFVMKTVSFPLSVAFIASDGTIVNIGRMDPGYRGSVTARVPVSYVLEMERGWFEQHGVGEGSHVLIP